MWEYRNTPFSKSYTSGFYENKNNNYSKIPMISIQNIFDTVEKLPQLPNSMENFIDVNWKSLSNYRDYKIFPDSFKPENFNQGSTGLCFLFSCLASIAGVPGLIYKIFDQDYNDQWMKTKLFIVYLFYNNERKKIVISDKFPFDLYNNNWIWSTPSGNELFAKIIEKAYLKYKLTYGNFNQNLRNISSLKKEIQKIIFYGGLEKEAMKILINTKEYKQIYPKPSHHNTEFEYEAMFNEIKHYSEKKNALITLSRKFDINTGHAYSVIGAWEIGDGYNKKKILCIKNPWDFGDNIVEKFDIKSLNNSLKNFPDLINFNKKYFNPNNSITSYNFLDRIVGNDPEKKNTSVFVAPLDYLVQNGLIRIEAHVPNYKVDFPSVKLELDLYKKLDKLFKKTQTNNVKNVFDSRKDGLTIKTRVLSIGEENEREIISNFRNQNFYKITKNGESYCELERRQDGDYNIQNMSEIFKNDYMDNNFLLINRKTGQKQIISLDNLISDEPEKTLDGYDLIGFEHSIKPFSLNYINESQKTFSNNFRRYSLINFENNDSYGNNYKNSLTYKNNDENSYSYRNNYKNSLTYKNNDENYYSYGNNYKNSLTYKNNDENSYSYRNNYGSIYTPKNTTQDKYKKKLLIEETIKPKLFRNPSIKNVIYKKKENKTINFSNGYYKGDVLNNKRHGKGKMYYYNGDYKDGLWHNDNFQSGNVKYTFDNKDKYIGEYSYGNINGEGTYTFKNGNYLKGTFYKGKLDGYGEERANGEIFKGSYKDGERHDHFKRIKRNGTIVYEDYEYGEKKSKCLIF